MSGRVEYKLCFFIQLEYFFIVFEDLNYNIQLWISRILYNTIIYS